jgi:type 1 glutamine amidotransferase
MPSILLVLTIFLLMPGSENLDHRSDATTVDSLSILVFSKTTGWRHDSIEAGVEAIREEATEHGMRVVHTEDAAQFTEENLLSYDVVVFLNTTGTLFDASQRAALQRFIRGGGGFVGVHSASDTEHDWPWFGRLVGAHFDNHPEIQDAVVLVEGAGHPSTRHLPPRWKRLDEWYNFKARPENVNVLLRIDTTTLKGGTMGEDHPIAWYHEFEGGRSWYTAGGHTIESYAGPDFRRHLIQGILWAAGAIGD